MVAAIEAFQALRRVREADALSPGAIAEAGYAGTVLVEKPQLPPNGPDGAPLSYKFHHKNSGRQIQDSQTLADNRPRSSSWREGIKLSRAEV